jgi:hypothetical protein
MVLKTPLALMAAFREVAKGSGAIQGPEPKMPGPKPAAQ